MGMLQLSALHSFAAKRMQLKHTWMDIHWLHGHTHYFFPRQSRQILVRFPPTKPPFQK